MIYWWYSDSLALYGWALPALVLREYNEDTATILDDYGHPHLLIKRSAERNVIRAIVEMPFGLLDEEGGPAGTLKLRDYLLSAYTGKAPQLIYDTDGTSYYSGYITQLDDAITSNQVIFREVDYVRIELTVTADGTYSDFEYRGALTPRERG
jgi:hypothetical protein